MLLLADIYVNYEYQQPSRSSVVMNYINGSLNSTTACKSITICHISRAVALKSLKAKINVH